MSCGNHKIPLEEIDFDLEEVCFRIETEVLLDDYITYHKPQLHPDYLNGVLATDEFCRQMQKAYSHCAFCMGAGFHLKCRLRANYTTCGGQLTKEEILSGNIVNNPTNNNNPPPQINHPTDNNPQPPQMISTIIQTQDDIDKTCQQLLSLEIERPDIRYPRSIDLCQRQRIVKHLCKGVCDGTSCFDSKDFPPTCDGPSAPPTTTATLNNSIGVNSSSNTNNNNNNITNGTTTFVILQEEQQESHNMDNKDYWSDICEELRKEAFGELSNEEVFLQAANLEYLRTIPENHPSCPLYREAYQHCFWCKVNTPSEGLCFHKMDPATCDNQRKPITLTEELIEFGNQYNWGKDDGYDVELLGKFNPQRDNLEANFLILKGCQLIFNALQASLPYYQDDIYDVPKHSQYLFLMKNTTKCNLARQIYRKCLWCEGNVLPCLTKDPCLIETIPSKFNPYMERLIDILVNYSGTKSSPSNNRGNGRKDNNNNNNNKQHPNGGGGGGSSSSGKPSWANRPNNGSSTPNGGGGGSRPPSGAGKPANAGKPIISPGDDDDDNNNEWNTSNATIDLDLWRNSDEICGSHFWDEVVPNFEEPYTLYSCGLAIGATTLCPIEFCRNITEANAKVTDYLGTTTQAQRKALIWASRISAILSFCGATFILVDILTNPKSRATVYHQLLIGMATFDIVTATSWSFATAAIDKDNPDANHVEGVIGTDESCTTQAFFIQLGFTSVFYNVSLAVYYVLVIAKGWKEFQLQQVRLYMHLVPITIGLGLALGAIPSYHWIEYACHIEPLYLDTTTLHGDHPGELWSVLVFVVLPLGLSILAITLSMGIVYNSVRKRSAASRKWSFGISKASKMEQAVFWQCLFYVTAFYVTWPIMFAVYLASIDLDGPLGLTMTVAFVAPLQGFSNFLAYIRPKLQRRLLKARNKSSLLVGGLSSVWSWRRTWFTANTTSNVTDTESRHPAPESGNSEATQDDLRGMDPSAALALQGYSFRQTDSFRPTDSVRPLGRTVSLGLLRQSSRKPSHRWTTTFAADGSGNREPGSSAQGGSMNTFGSTGIHESGSGNGLAEEETRQDDPVCIEGAVVGDSLTKSITRKRISALPRVMESSENEECSSGVDELLVDTTEDANPGGELEQEEDTPNPGSP